MSPRTRPECRLLIEQLSAYLDGDLSASRCRTIARHARACSRCADVIRDLQVSAGLCHQAAARPLPDAVRRRARARVRKLLHSGR